MIIFEFLICFVVWLAAEVAQWLLVGAVFSGIRAVVRRVWSGAKTICKAIGALLPAHHQL